MIWDEFTSTLADILSILGHTIVTITESKEKKDLWQMIPGVWEKFLHLRSFTWSGNWAKSSRPVWRKVTLRPPGLLWMPPSPAVVTIKRPAIQPSPSLSTHFSINMKMAKESQTQIYKFAPSIQWKDNPSKFFQMVCTAGQKLKLGQFWSLQRSPHLKIGKHEMDSVK